MAIQSNAGTAAESSKLPRASAGSSPARLERPARRPLTWGEVFLGIILIVALLAAFFLYRMHEDANSAADRVEKWAGAVRDAFVSVGKIQPRVTINDQVVFEQASPVLELAVLDRNTQVEREFTASWMGSTKRIRLRGLYEVKAGYDLREPFTARIVGGQGETVKVQVPRARILGVEQKKVEVLELSNGLWNIVRAEELQSEINALATEAREKAQRSGMIHEAQASFEKELRDKIGSAYRLDISTADEAASSPEASGAPSPRRVPAD